ncbi:MAG: DUF2089 domain-containing protein [Anaerolineaceae bacterium]|nr:DUF2089 domain-containing protein [Anaerolineaceae bacterium]
MNQLPKNCPICQGNVVVTRFFCPDCQTSVEGNFVAQQSPFQNLTADQMNFLLTFVRSEGRLNRMEEILGLSYPTLKNRLNDVIMALGFQPEKEVRFKLSDSHRQQILYDLENGRIDSTQALRYLQGEDEFNLI